MGHDGEANQKSGGLPSLGRMLGLAGLLPQAAAVLAIAVGGDDYRWAALSLSFAYAAAILSFLGGIWWGFAARAGASAPAWLWVAAVAPSLLAVAASIPWVIGWPWPEPSLAALAAAIAMSPLIDAALERRGLTPSGWTRFRVTLSAGLALLTGAAAVL